MLVILNSLNAHNFPNFKPILMTLVSKCMVHIVLSDKTYLSLGLLSPLTYSIKAGLQIRVPNEKLFFLFLNQNVCCGYSKELPH